MFGMKVEKSRWLAYFMAPLHELKETFVEPVALVKQSSVLTFKLCNRRSVEQGQADCQ
jgi:hypothetical protein